MSKKTTQKQEQELEDLEYLIEDEPDLDDDEEEEDEDTESLTESKPLHQLVEDEMGSLETEIDAVEEELAGNQDEETEEEEDEDEDGDEEADGGAVDEIDPSQEGWTCSGCFIKVSPSQFGPIKNPTCPSGESICPAMNRFFK